MCLRLTFFQLLSRTKAMVPFYIIPAYKKLLPVQTICNGFKDLNELNQNLCFWFWSGKLYWCHRDHKWPDACTTKVLPFLKLIYSEKATKFCEIFTLLLTTVHTVKSKVKISRNFVAFSEYMNFKTSNSCQRSLWTPLFRDFLKLKNAVQIRIQLENIL